MTIDASSMSWCSSASSVRSSVVTTRSSAAERLRPRARAAPRWKCWRACRVASPCRDLAELAGDVLLGALVARVGEDLLGRSTRQLDRARRSSMKNAVVSADARGLLHVVRDDHDRVALLELLDQLLDLQRRDRVQRRARARPSGAPRARPRSRARCTGAAAGRRRGPMPGLPSRSLTSSHRPAPRSDASTRSSQVGLRLAAVEPQAGGDVVEDRHRRERVGLLEDHADRAADRDDVDAGRRRCRRRRAGPRPRRARRGSPRACG